MGSKYVSDNDGLTFHGTGEPFVLRLSFIIYNKRDFGTTVSVIANMPPITFQKCLLLPTNFTWRFLKL